MGDKSIRKKQYIIEKAREVFIEKGFLTVTMKDIVEACEISRGGLYLYFPDTETLFLEVLRKEREEGNSEELEKADTAVEMLSLFLREQKKEVLQNEKSLIVPLYEYYFYLRQKQHAAAKEQTQAQGDAAAREVKEPAAKPEELTEKERFEMSVKVLEKLIIGGMREGYLACDDPGEEAKNIMFAMEGLKICAVTIGLSEEEVTGQINYLYSHLFIRD